MLSIANVGGSKEASHYYEKTDDYYTKDKSPSQWYGNLSQTLKLSGEVKAEDFNRLLDGNLPNGETIHIPANGRRGGTDLTFSAPKSLSLQALIGNDHCLIDAHDRAVRETLRYAETLVSYRQTINGETQNKESQKMIAATFRHELSREADPQIHTHSVILNLTQRPDKEWRAIDNESFYQQKMLMGAFYRTELAREVQKLGYSIRVKDGFFELAHISENQIKAFSQRSLSIERILKEKGLDRDKASSEEKQAITLETRKKKSNIDRSQLKEFWKEKSQDLKINYQQKLFPQEKKQSFFKQRYESIQFALKHHLEKQSVVTEDKILKEALIKGMGQVTYKELNEEINREVNNGIIIQDQDRYTTPEAIQLEKRTLSLALGKKSLSIVKNKKDERIQFKDSPLNQGQKEAARHILTSKDQYVGIQGLAGTGKTFMLKNVQKIIQEKGFKTIGLAPSAAAADELSKTGIQSSTIHSFQAKKDKQLSSKTILVIDEAGMVSTKQMESIFKEAKKYHSKVVLIGDTQQLKAIEAGKPFAQLIQNGMKIVTMDQIQRQKNPELKKAVEHAAKGDITKSVSLLQKSIYEINDQGKRYQKIANDYSSLPERERKNSLILAGTNEARKSINEKVRENLRLQGKGRKFTVLDRKDLSQIQKKDTSHYKINDQIQFQKDYKSIQVKKDEIYSIEKIQNNFIILKREDGSAIKWKPKQKSKVDVYERKEIELSKNDSIRITKNQRDKNLINGDRFQISQINSDRTIEIKSERGKLMRLDAKKPLHLDYAYCSTVHSAQGRTCERVLVEADTKSLTSAKDNYYVAISRAKQQAKIYTDNRQKLPEAMKRENIKEAALELRKESSKSERNYEFKQLNSMTRT